MANLEGLMKATMVLFAIYFLCQTPISIVYLVFASTEPESTCMDSTVGGLTVRPWFWGIGITEFAILGFFLIFLFVMCCRCGEGC